MSDEDDVSLEGRRRSRSGAARAAGSAAGAAPLERFREISGVFAGQAVGLAVSSIEPCERPRFWRAGLMATPPNGGS